MSDMKPASPMQNDGGENNSRSMDYVSRKDDENHANKSSLSSPLPSPKFDKNKVFRTTRCFSPRNNGYPGGFPIGFLNWVKENGWIGDKRCYLCSGMVDDIDAVRVDIEPSTNPSHCEDATNTSLPAESFDWIMIDPPYSKELAESLYGKGKYFKSINVFCKEAERLCANGGLILTLSYEIPKRIPNCDLIACVGVYQTMGVSFMRCFSVWRKKGVHPDDEV